jgi:hypothetical protein
MISHYIKFLTNVLILTLYIPLNALILNHVLSFEIDSIH